MSDWAKGSAEREFTNALQRAGQGRFSSYQMLVKFLDVMSMAFECHNQVIAATIEDTELQEKIKAERANIPDPKAFYEAVTIFINTLQENPRDFLGQIYCHAEYADKNRLGQVFTPDHISLFMAHMSLSNIDTTQYSIEEPIAILEPSCGAGAMIIAASNYLRSKNISNRIYEITAYDIDYQCVQMTFIQSCVLDIPVIVEHRNALGIEVWKRLVTPVAQINRIIGKILGASEDPEHTEKLCKLLQTIGEN